MSVIHVGSNEKYANGWEKAFGGAKKKTAKKKTAKKKTAKSAKKKAKK